jgi:hypothetical protein
MPVQDLAHYESEREIVVVLARGPWLEGLPNTRRSRWRAEGPTERKLQTRRPLDGNDRTLEAHQITTLMSAFGGKADMAYCSANDRY